MSRIMTGTEGSLLEKALRGTIKDYEEKVAKGIIVPSDSPKPSKKGKKCN